MTIVYKNSQGGEYVATDGVENAERHAPFIVMPDMVSARGLASHLNGHRPIPKKLCSICGPTGDAGGARARGA